MYCINLPVNHKNIKKAIDFLRYSFFELSGVLINLHLVSSLDANKHLLVVGSSRTTRVNK